ncbi:MAG TPA: NAD(P)-dependent alcohol dehydrogenase [Pseudomonadales bacterium]|nr:NAD(P)-dependent alcohol dehydrogenase [Pseudomonadales bacterium]
MKAWQIRGEYGIDKLQCIDVPEPSVAPGRIVVDMRAASLNFRDLATVRGFPGAKAPPALIPCSDGAGVVRAVGDGVRDVRVGDRVAPTFFQSWIDGPVTAEARSLALGGSLDGVLQERIALAADGVIKIPQSMSFDEAATLPCAGLTAWRAIAVEAPVGPGDTVLVQGTGGVSIFALQFAKSRGARVIVTSSSDAKLDRARALGADHGINYATTPNWSAEVRRLTENRGVDVVVEVGGENTLAQALQCTRVGGAIVVIGVLSGFSSAIPLPLLFSNNLRLIGISVGSRAQFADMLAHIEAKKLKPVIDKTFGFAQVPEALTTMQSGKFFGKLCIRFDA